MMYSEGQRVRFEVLGRGGAPVRGEGLITRVHEGLEELETRVPPRVFPYEVAVHPHTLTGSTKEDRAGFRNALAKDPTFPFAASELEVIE
jgi:hypothetical protein